MPVQLHLLQGGFSLVLQTMVREQKTRVRVAGTAYWGELGLCRCRKIIQVCFKQGELDPPTGSKCHSVLPQNRPVTKPVPGQGTPGRFPLGQRSLFPSGLRITCIRRQGRNHICGLLPFLPRPRGASCLLFYVCEGLSREEAVFSSPALDEW